ncbi:hypothetical protein DM01DRAFT_1338824 [Hesseltinella vesiculosa]|uniref:Uncharacterized protein n=1 Tax=Hesseltinella vesiculosa TaxID=101127 RepID=A0A1X2G9X2_9FUNG|nr:hypothetical protein DM01DRAFT_1338824 [Hesseltinella vesiculosa]
MLKGISDNQVYDHWLRSAGSIEPAYDYFSFADLVNRDRATTNVSYLSIMNHFSKKHPSNEQAVSALNTFNKRKTSDSNFHKKYEDYWHERDEHTLIIRMRNRALSTTESVHSDACEQVERLSKKACQIAPSSVDSGSSVSPVLESAESVSTMPSETEIEYALKAIAETKYDLCDK